MAGGFAVSNRVVARNNIGRFIHECEMAAERTVEKAVKEGADLSRSFAPVGHKADLRTIPLKESIYTKMYGRTSGEWGARARHALAQEKGAAPHIIAGDPDLSFFWEAKGRRFIPAQEFFHTPGLVTIVNHPGNPAQPYLRPAYELISQRIMAIARGEYPG